MLPQTEFQLNQMLNIYYLDNDLGSQKFYQNLLEVHNKVFSNDFKVLRIKNELVLDYFEFNFKRLNMQFGPEDDDFIDNVFMLSHDKEFQIELLIAFETIYLHTINPFLSLLEYTKTKKKIFNYKYKVLTLYHPHFLNYVFLVFSFYFVSMSASVYLLTGLWGIGLAFVATIIFFFKTLRIF